MVYFVIRTMFFDTKHPRPTWLVKILGFSTSANTLSLHCIKIPGLTPVKILEYLLRRRFFDTQNPWPVCLFKIHKNKVLGIHCVKILGWTPVKILGFLSCKPGFWTYHRICSTVTRKHAMWMSTHVFWYQADSIQSHINSRQLVDWHLSSLLSPSWQSGHIRCDSNKVSKIVQEQLRLS